MAAEQANCALCGHPLAPKGNVVLTVATGKPEERKLEFCSDSHACRRRAYDLYVEHRG